MYRISLAEATQTLASLVQQAVEGEEIIITQDDKPLVKIVSVNPARPRARFGSAKGLITISDDFNEPLEDFKEYM